MRKVIIKIAGYTLKFSAIIFLSNICIQHIRPDLAWYIQSPIVWVGVYLPLWMGYETLAKLVFDTLSGSKPIEKR